MFCTHICMHALPKVTIWNVKQIKTIGKRRLKFKLTFASRILQVVVNS